MRVLIVIAHPEPQSFTHALAQAGVRRLEGLGHYVDVADLYAEGFSALAGPGDVLTRKDPARFNLASEQGHAALGGGFAPDIARDQARVQAADLIILHFPLWWYSMPAILKGWIERVFAFKVAYDVGRWWDQGLFAGKKAMIVTTTGSGANAYMPDGRNGDLDRILWPIQAGTLRMCGFDVLKPHVLYGIAWVDDAQRQAMIEAYAQRLDGLFSEAPVSFHDLEDFGPDQRLKPDVTPKTPGQHRPG